MGNEPIIVVHDISVENMSIVAVYLRDCDLITLL